MQDQAPPVPTAVFFTAVQDPVDTTEDLDSPSATPCNLAALYRDQPATDAELARRGEGEQLTFGPRRRLGLTVNFPSHGADPMTTASIQFSQGSSVGVAGQAFVGASSSTPVVIQNGNNAGVTYWKIILLDGPPGLSTPNGTILAQGAGSTPYASLPWTAGVYGTAQVRLILNQTDVPSFNATTTIYDDRDFIVPYPDGWYLPAFRSTDVTYNYGGQLLGWKTSINALLAALRYNTNIIGSFRSVADNTTRDAISSVLKADGQTVVYTYSTNKWWLWQSAVWVDITPSGGGGGTLTGDANGALASNTVSHVTGTIATKVEGSTSVALRVLGSDVLTASSGAVSFGTGSSPSITWGTGAPSAAANNGSLYFRTDGASNTTLYERASGAWTPFDPTGGGGSTLSGDANGALLTNTVKHVTGDVNTVVDSTTSVALAVGGSNRLKATASGIVIFQVGSSSSGILYLDTDGALKWLSMAGEIYTLAPA